MKAVKINKAGGPEVLELEDITLRKPVRDEVIIEHEAIGLNYIDTYHRSGLYPLIFPSGLGMEATGTIKEAGPDVKDFSIGDKVAYASVPLGAYSSHRLFKTKSLVKVPNEINLTLAATMASTLLALYHVGVEQNLWESISACKTTAIGHISVEELKKALLERPALSCANIEWSVFGISMAGYNSLYSLFLAFMSVLVLRKLKEENIG